MGHDLLEGAAWECCATSPGAALSPGDLDKLPVSWLAASVPGTAAGAVAAVSGRRRAATVDYDGSDWWFRTRVPVGGEGTWTLTFEGLATVADVWFRGQLVAHAENMFVPHRIALATVAADDELSIRFAALTPLLGGRRPRPRWKTMMADHQGLRWFRTTFLGRQPGWTVTPAPVGPWRPVRLVAADSPVADSPVMVGRRVVATCDDGDDGVVSVMVRLVGVGSAPDDARVRVSRVGIEKAEAGRETSGPVTVRTEGSDVVVEGEVVVTGIERWWPHTHGGQPLYAVTVEMGDRTIEVGRVGFRSFEVDRSGGAFRPVVNGVEVFCRGACWWPIDPVDLYAGDDELRETLELVRSGHMNMVRIPGGTVYEDDRFWDLCDELGIMVWQDCMLGYTDPPEDEAYEAEVVAELEQVFGGLGGRPALAVVCGGQEIEEQAAMFGLSRERWSCSLTERTIPELAARLLPGVPYVTSSPTGGDLPFQPDAGDCHYWGVGTNLRTPDDARRCGIRFMSEGMAFATPPERQTVEEACGGAMKAGHDPEWKQAVHHDTGRSWDLEDVRDFYVHEVFGVDPHMLRYLDPERALDLGRAVVAELMARTFSEWRRAGSTCAGGLLVAFRDLVPGAGWGLVDALGRPKAPWFTLRRVLAPVAVVVTDEGLNGLHLHLVNDTSTDFAGEVKVELFARGEVPVEAGGVAVEIPARGQLTVEAGALFDGFRDLSYAYRYGPPPYDVIVVALGDATGRVVSEVVQLPAGLDRPSEPEIGLTATARPGVDGEWLLSVTTRCLAQWVVVEVPGFGPSDSWFHLAPGASRTVSLAQCRGPGGGPERPSGQVRALNSQAAARIVIG
jgi:beta-mannosidase